MLITLLTLDLEQKILYQIKQLNTFSKILMYLIITKVFWL